MLRELTLIELKFLNAKKQYVYDNYLKISTDGSEFLIYKVKTDEEMLLQNTLKILIRNKFNFSNKKVNTKWLTFV